MCLKNVRVNCCSTENLLQPSGDGSCCDCLVKSPLLQTGVVFRPTGYSVSGIPSNIVTEYSLGKVNFGCSTSLGSPDLLVLDPAL